MQRDQEHHDHAENPGICGCLPAEMNALSKAPAGQEAEPSTQEAKHLNSLKRADFELYNQQRWDRLGEVYGKNLEVTYSDLRVSRGLDAYVENLRIRNDFSPDSHIGAHLISFASEEWTALMRTSEGTFTRPLAGADGKAAVSPNGKRFKNVETVVSHWQDGVIDRQFHFWDTGVIAQQLAIAPSAGAASADQDVVKIFHPLATPNRPTSSRSACTPSTKWILTCFRWSTWLV